MTFAYFYFTDLECDLYDAVCDMQRARTDVTDPTRYKRLRQRLRRVQRILARLDEAIYPTV